MWQQDDDGVLRDWGIALSHCENLILAGYSDWRLPDVRELGSLVYTGGPDSTPAPPIVNTNYFAAMQIGPYWTSTPHVSPDEAWSVGFANVIESRRSKATFLLTKCVR